jgi:predicted pyridoxine 5'-phosphate oxidase superfamily flavin-nucleotide-binding protein
MMETSPFHPGELAAQDRAGGGAPGGGIRPYMPDQHRLFFAMLPHLFVASVDGDGWPMAGILTGEPGFIASPDPAILGIRALPLAGDPLHDLLVPGAPVGLLGIDLSNRRRNRANGIVAGRAPEGFVVAVRQSFGNCPQYIQTRLVHADPETPGPLEKLAGLDQVARDIIARADTCFVASWSGPGGDLNGGVDISHRGGLPGFVHAEGDVLTIPDFRGNRYFNTLGNLAVHPRAGLLFVDFETGDVLHLNGEVEIVWDIDGHPAPPGAERLWRFRVTRAWRRARAVPLRWAFDAYAPTSLRAGSWPEAA